MIKGNAVIGQSGGPTSVINSSLAGVVTAAGTSDLISGIYGMNYGIEGLMNEWLFDLGAQPDDIIRGLRHTPSSALGSSRHKLKEEDFPRILSVLERYDIRYMFLIGGNDTMDRITSYNVCYTKLLRAVAGKPAMPYLKYLHRSRQVV